MTTIRDAYEAGVDAVLADNTLNKGGFADAIRTVLVSNFTNAEATAWIDAMAAEYNRLGQTNTDTYGQWRNQIIDLGKATALELFDALQVNITGLAESVPAIESALLIDLRDERDSVDAAIDRFDVLIAAEPNGTVGRLVKDEMRGSKARLRERKQRLRAAIEAITGDPDGL